MQLMAPWRQDERLLRLGAWLERRLHFPRLVIDDELLANRIADRVKL